MTPSPVPRRPRPPPLQAVNDTGASNAKWVPPYKNGTLYLRPLLFGSGAQLGVAPSPMSTFCIYASPVGNYFKGQPGELAPAIDLQVSSVPPGSARRTLPPTSCQPPASFESSSSASQYCETAKSAPHLARGSPLHVRTSLRASGLIELPPRYARWCRSGEGCRQLRALLPALKASQGGGVFRNAVCRFGPTPTPPSIFTTHYTHPPPVLTLFLLITPQAG